MADPSRQGASNMNSGVRMPHSAQRGLTPPSPPAKPSSYRRLWDGLVRGTTRTVQILMLAASLAVRWRVFIYAVVLGMAVAFAGARIVAWLQASVPEATAATVASTNRPGRQTRSVPDLGSVSALVRQCAPSVSPNTMLAIMRTESSFNTLALHVNADLKLQRAPSTTAEAIGWSRWLIDRGYSVDMGLMQINSRNLARLQMSVADAFEPCRNIHGASLILVEQYRRASQAHAATKDALLSAISAYNTGNFRAGFRNGYVSKVLTNAGPP
jgi:soluble lytic murein transglycosylase-like protein